MVLLKNCKKYLVSTNLKTIFANDLKSTSDEIRECCFQFIQKKDQWNP